MKSEVQKLLERHSKLSHSEHKRVVSHTQRETQDWIINTVILEGYSVAFRFRRKRPYRNLAGSYVNLTYYPDTETVAGIAMEVMKVVRIKVA